VKIDGVDDAGHLGGEIGAIDRDQAADRTQRRLPAGRGRDGGGHGLRLGTELRQELRDQNTAHRAKAEHPAENHADDGQHHNHARCHLACRTHCLFLMA
jgi:hypothetical protein